MKSLLKRGDILNTSDGLKVKVKKFIGGGGQGEVYKAEINGREYALKWYNSQCATKEQLNSLEALIATKAPSERYLWPSWLVYKENTNSFGYIMELREERFKNVLDILNRKCPCSFKNLLMACYNLADSFQLLHLIGRCYKDINFMNVFIDNTNGDIRICDNDNVTVNGDYRSGICGTPGFMAPEIYRGEAYPSTETDKYSLGVLLFYMLMISHPLEGRRESDIEMMGAEEALRLYGTEPVFIWDPIDNSNRPVPGYHDAAIFYWNIYPKVLKDIFTELFTKGLMEPSQRVSEMKWKSVLLNMINGIAICSECNAENFYDIYKFQARNGHYCWSCGKKLKLPPRLKIGNKVIVLYKDMEIYSYVLNYEPELNIKSVAARVVVATNSEDAIGLKNFSSVVWSGINSDGSTFTVPPGKCFKLERRQRIDFGKVKGEISF